MARKKDDQPTAKIISLDEYRQRIGLQPKGSPYREDFWRRRDESQKERLEEERKKHNAKVLRMYKLIN